MPGSRLRRALIAAMLVIGLVACGGSGAKPRTSGPASRNDAGPVREDLAPLTKRFGALGEPVAARWKSGTFGDPDVPGPSTYWIDAIVRLEPEVAARLAAGTSSAEAPDVVHDLAVELPHGPWVGSEQLDRSLSTAGFGSKVRLDATTATVVVRAIGEG